MTNQEIAFRIANDDENALTELMVRHRGWIYRRAYNSLHCPLDAQEVVQDCFLKVWAYRHRYDQTRGAFTTWLTVIVRSEVAHAYQKKMTENKRHVGDLMASDEETDRIVAMPDTYQASPDEALMIADQMRLIEQALCEMPNRSMQICWVLYHFEGYTLKAVGKIIKRSAPRVRTLVIQATHYLREALSINA